MLAAASSGVGECQGGVKDVETMMVAGFGMVGQAGEASTLEQSTRRHLERVDTHAWHHGHAWSPRELSPQASLRPKNHVWHVVRGGFEVYHGLVWIQVQ